MSEQKGIDSNEFKFQRKQINPLFYMFSLTHPCVQLNMRKMKPSFYFKRWEF